jgi:hypothetical protein
MHASMVYMLWLTVMKERAHSSGNTSKRRLQCGRSMDPADFFFEHDKKEQA